MPAARPCIPRSDRRICGILLGRTNDSNGREDQRLRDGRSSRTDGHSNTTNHRSEGCTALGDHASWDDAERIAVNVGRLYREFADDDSAPDVRTPLGHVAELGSS
jgi:hypothetical protein